jgi:hypothetical protein
VKYVIKEPDSGAYYQTGNPLAWTKNLEKARVYETKSSARRGRPHACASANATWLHREVKEVVPSPGKALQIVPVKHIQKLVEV